MKLSRFITGALLAGLSATHGAKEPIPRKGVFRDVVEISNAKRETSDLAKAAQNPIANMISLPLQDNINTGIGPNDETQNVLNIQPVYPFAISENWNVITRTILPVISQPDVLTGGNGRVDGVGDLNFTAFFSPAAASKVTWGVGPAVVLPTGSNPGKNLGSEKWSAGPALVVLTMPGHWVIGSLFSDVISLGGSGDDVHLFTWQYFINYNLPKGWYLSTSPIMTANWEASSSDTWTVPLGAGAGKIFKIGKQPLNLQAHAYKNVVSPTYGADWQFRLQLQFLFPK